MRSMSCSQENLLLRPGMVFSYFTSDKISCRSLLYLSQFDLLLRSHSKKRLRAISCCPDRKCNRSRPELFQRSLNCALDIYRRRNRRSEESIGPTCLPSHEE